ncbi:Cytochrome P450 monooxygenase paxP [Sparassis crispa]|uniref:Cytochrome P450 monooxygenase paxP n=1 Tax=Sparassis crispa TaxID=139825 RepID=A0A401H651_9APHY|nr:Cytochrome P450 monooxygenase paxP [Sparassis crispa]GBE89830.1 Cytochrome P450 monooxygenase paxP [Sparassis crispa]
MASSAFYAFVGVLSVLYFVQRVSRSSRALHAIPTVGPSAPLLSYIGAYKYVRHAKTMLQEGYDKYKGSVFKIPMLDQWLVVVSGPKLVEELRMLPDDQASFVHSIEETTQTRYTMGPSITDDPYHVPIIRDQLTRGIRTFLPDVTDEIDKAFQDLIPATEDGWIDVPVLSVMRQIVARASNRVFVGLPKCRDQDFLDLAIGFTLDITETRVYINLFPKILKPIAGRIFSRVRRAIRRASSHLKPIMEERKRKLAEFGDDWANKPSDMLMWLMDGAKEKENWEHSVLERFLVLCFAAIHTSSNSMTHALYHIAANPGYIQPLREEVESIVKEEGWNKASVSKMLKLDSFMRESQRFNGIVGISRKAMKDITLSNGTMIPKGTLIVAAAAPMHLDKENYLNADVFDPFRFSNLRAGEGEGTKYQFVSTSPEYIPFGHGKHACPGRFFAASELKVMLAYVVLNYDIKFEGGGKRPENLWINASIVPAPGVKVMFRKRRSADSKV